MERARRRLRILIAVWLVLLVLLACRVTFPTTGPLPATRTPNPAASQPEVKSATRSPAASPTSPTPTPLPPTPTSTLEPTVAVLPLQETVAIIPAPSLAGSLFGDPTEQAVQIYLPPSYDTSDLRYPVVYFLPGFGGDTQGHSGYFDTQSVASLMASGQLKEMILVVPNGANLLGGSFYVNSTVSGNWEDFITQDVVGYVDANYRTIKAAEGRGIGGHSMGGFGALNLAMRRPDLFSAVYSLSPGLFDKHGLADSHMFDDKKKPKAFLEHQAHLKSLTRESAIQEMINYEGALGFTTAYGAAFAPDPNSGPPFFKYPYAMVDGEIQRLPPIWAIWDRGFGDWKNKLVTYQDNLAELNGIIFDYGNQDIFPWIQTGSVYLAKLMQEAGLPAELYVFDGGHSDRIEERIQTIGLPFFSKLLADPK